MATGYPVTLLVHGGFWQSHVALDHMAPLAQFLSSRGWAVINLEYRRQLNWRQSCADVKAGIALISQIAKTFRLDPSRVVVVGHSAGAHLLHAATRTSDRELGQSAAGQLLVSLAGVLNLEAARKSNWGRTILDDLERNTPDVAIHDPFREGASLPSLLVHGTNDTSVPPEQSSDYWSCHRLKGKQCDLLVLPGLDHMDLIKPDLPHWTQIEELMVQAVGGTRGASGS